MDVQHQEAVSTLDIKSINRARGGDSALLSGRSTAPLTRPVAVGNHQDARRSLDCAARPVLLRSSIDSLTSRWEIYLRSVTNLFNFFATLSNPSGERMLLLVLLVGVVTYEPDEQ